MLTRRDFLRRTSLALAGGLLLGDAALEAFERLTHRKVFALGAPVPRVTFFADKVQDRATFRWGANVTDAWGHTQEYFNTGTLVSSYGTPSPADRKQALFGLFKTGQRIEREHGIPLDSMIPAMERALA